MPSTLPLEDSEAQDQTVAWIPVESSVIDAVRYDSRGERLDIRFTSGDVYRYAEVPPFVMRAFMAAPSKGEYFNAEIRDGYDYERL
jgi:lysyl-tRNA synthetase class 2